MSRLTNKPISDGDAIDAASLNTRYADFTQTTLNEFNTRDAAIDLPQFTAAKFMVPEFAQRLIGHQDWTHTAYNTVAGQLTGAAPHVIRDAAGLTTPLALGSGWLVSPGQILRVYWDLSVKSHWLSFDPWIGTDWTWTFDKFVSGTTEVGNGSGCWALWLQWDTTDATLTNWTNVPTQESFNTVVVGTRGGNLLSNCQATSIVPATQDFFEDPRDGSADTRTGGENGWTSVDGAWHYIPGSPITIYGLRVVVTGPLGAYHAASNWLIRAEDALVAEAELYYNGGSLQALLMRTA
jgi:hypothetical protein